MPSFPTENLHRFSHEAMATHFEIFVYSSDFDYAQGAAVDAFRLLAQLEQELSRYIENSDISRINSLKVGQSTQISLETFECLVQCHTMYRLTGGTFDVTVGKLMDAWLDDDNNIRQVDAAELKKATEQTGMYKISFNDQDFSVTMEDGPVCLDLGGFGKGFAVDKMADLLEEYDLPQYFIHGGSSSVLAGDAPPETKGWPITLSNPFDNNATIKRMTIENQSLSGSGIQKGSHIIDPRSFKPIKQKLAAWSFAPSAAVSDALSTTFMLLQENEIRAFIENTPSVQAVLVYDVPDSTNDRIVEIGYNKS